VARAQVAPRDVSTARGLRSDPGARTERSSDEKEVNMSFLDKIKEHARLSHAMQAGVALLMHQDPTETSPKHLRVGVNVALADQGALVKLLIDKGVITEDEYGDAIVAGMQREVDSYTERLTPPGSTTKITLV
jgi:hypothetical protein